MCSFSTTVRYVKGLVNTSTFHYLSSEQNIISLCTPINHCDSLNYSRHLKKPPNFISLITAWIPICPFWQWKRNKQFPLAFFQTPLPISLYLFHILLNLLHSISVSPFYLKILYHKAINNQNSVPIK